MFIVSVYLLFWGDIVHCWVLPFLFLFFIFNIEVLNIVMFVQACGDGGPHENKHRIGECNNSESESRFP